MTDLRTTPEEAPSPGWARLVTCVAHEATATDVRNIRRWGAWLVAWALANVADAEWFGGVTGETSTASVGLLLVLAVTTVGLVVAFARFINDSDELNRSIHLRGLGVGFATGFLVTAIGEAVQKAGLVEAVGVDVVAMALILGYGLSTIAITARYR